MDNEKKEIVFENGEASSPKRDESGNLSDSAADEPLASSPLTQRGDSDSEVDTCPRSDGVLHQCGCGPFQPKRLQIFVSAKFFTFILCTYSLIEGTLVTGFRTVVVSTLEKRYHFSSTASSIILAAFDAAVVLSVIFYSYFSQKANKPRILAAGLIIQGVGAFTYAFPQFVFGSYKIGSNENLRLESCDASHESNDLCDPANYVAFVLFVVGDFLIGVGAAPLFTVGVSFIDDIVHPKYVPIHMGIFFVTAIIGPAVGYGLGGAFLSIYVDPWKVPTVGQKDPGWVGAWWLCFIVGGCLSFLLSIPFFMFPRTLHDTHHVTEERKKEMAQNYSSKYSNEQSLTVQLKAFPAHFKKLFESVTWVLTTAAVALLFFSLDGMINFGPKYLEFQFRLTSSSASLIMGGLAIPTAGLGVLSGAVILYFLKSKGRRAAAISSMVLVFSIVPAIVAFLLSCPDEPIAGISTKYFNSSIVSSEDVLLSSCNYDCNCSSTVFEPVCGADGITYFSPCRAGCQKRLVDGVPNQAVFENCTCVADNLYSGLNVTSENTYWSVVTTNSSASNGWCESDCNILPLFLLLVGIFLILVFMLKVPTYVVTLRSVAEEQRTLALGVQSVIFRSFGSIPGPLVYGAVIDSACQYSHDVCGIKGNCWVYDSHQLSVKAVITGITGIVLGTVCAILAWVFYPRKTSLREEEEEREDELQLLDGDDTNDEQETQFVEEHAKLNDINPETQYSSEQTTL